MLKRSVFPPLSNPPRDAMTHLIIVRSHPERSLAIFVWDFHLTTQLQNSVDVGYDALPSSQMERGVANVRFGVHVNFDFRQKSLEVKNNSVAFGKLDRPLPQGPLERKGPSTKG